jgi:hypothetical protein
MKRTSVRTLVLLLELLAAVTAYQFLAWTPPAHAAAVWLGDDPNEVVDPNSGDDDLPESIGAAPRIRLDDDPNDPNVPDAGEELPESIGGPARIWLDDDPNDPNVPDAGEELPEAAGAPALRRL